METTSIRILKAQPINYWYCACAVRQGFALYHFLDSTAEMLMIHFGIVFDKLIIY